MEPDMTSQDRPRTDPIAAHAYTLPVVREVPIGSSSPASEQHGLAQPVGYAADAHAW
jgi:hypothetical protein